MSGEESDGLPGPVAELVEASRRVGRLSWDDLDAGCLTGTLAALQSTEATLAATTAAVIRACRAADLPRASGAADTSQWLTETCRLSGREAARQARRAQTLDALPETSAALAAGELSVGHAAVIGRAADTQRLGDPTQTEAVLLEAAEAETPDRLRRTVTSAEQAADDNALLADENRAYGRRRASAGPDAEGCSTCTPRWIPPPGRWSPRP